jgi:hypothetical protein
VSLNLFFVYIDLPVEKREILRKRMRMLLFTTFDKGFEFPEHQWTIEQLGYRLQLIRSLLALNTAAATPVEELEDVSGALLAQCVASFIPVSCPHETKFPLDKAAAAFLNAKRKFIANHSRNYKWTEGSCQWLDDVHNMAERKNYDTLTYYLLNQNWSIIICCTANINKTGQYILLSIGSIVHGLYIGIPIGEYAVNNLDETDIYDDFETELKNLIRLVCKRKAEIRQ